LATFRWIVGVLALLFATGALLSYVLFVAFDIELWKRRARTLRRGLYMTLLLWFNVEVWSRLLWALIDGG
jgi:hypothetical protein